MATRKKINLRAKLAPKARLNRRKVGRDARTRETYAIYVGDKVNASGTKLPIIGTISIASLEKLKLKLADLQKFPDSTYQTSTGLQLKYAFKDRVLYKSLTGKVGQTDYNSTIPIPVETNPSKLELYVKDTSKGNDSTPTRDKATIGIPAATPAGTVALFVEQVLKLDKNPLALKWKWGKLGVTLQELGGTSKRGGGRKKEIVPEWFVPIGYDGKATLTKTGAVSTAAANNKKTLIVATMPATTAEALGFGKEDKGTVAEIKRGSFQPAGIDNNITGAKASYFKLFEKLKIYSVIWDVTAKGEDAVALDPGTGLSVKVRFTSFRGGAQSSNIVTRQRTRDVNKSSATYAFSLPSGIPVMVVFQMLMNCVKRPSSFQISTDGKTYGKSYRLPKNSQSRGRI